MATYYVSNVDGNDADNGSTWALAKATVAGALAVATGTGPHLIYVDSAHAENSGSASIAWNAATASAQVSIISVNRNGSNTTGHSGWLAGAQATIGANTFGWSIATARSQALYLYGLTMTGSSGSSSSNLFNVANGTSMYVTVTFDTCTFNQPGSSSSAAYLFGVQGLYNAFRPKLTFKNCTINIRSSTSGSGVNLDNADGFMSDTTFGFAGANKPTSLFSQSASNPNTYGNWLIQDCDLSGYNLSTGAYFLLTVFCQDIRLVNCRLSSSPAYTSGTFPTHLGSITAVSLDSGGTNYRFRYDNAFGTLTEETTKYRNGGAVFDGSGISLKILTTSLASEYTPFYTPWIRRWISSTGSQAFKLEVIGDSATSLKDHEVWAEFDTISSASYPLGTLTTTRNTTPTDTSGSNLTNSSDTWTGTFTNPNPQYLSATINAAQKSPLRTRLGVSLASATLYLCPGVKVGSQSDGPSVRWALDGPMVAEPASAGTSGGFVIGG